MSGSKGVDDVGNPYITPVTLSPQAAIDCLADLTSEGFDQIIMPNVTDQDLFDLLATRIIPVVETITVAGR